MPETLDHSFFQPRLNDTFRIDEGPLELKLVSCNQLKEHIGSVRTPFALLFLGPVDPVLPQRIYALNNEQTGPLEIFLVPVARDRAGTTYEAVFN